MGWGSWGLLSPRHCHVQFATIPPAAGIRHRSDDNRVARAASSFQPRIDGRKSKKRLDRFRPRWHQDARRCLRRKMECHRSTPAQNAWTRRFATAESNASDRQLNRRLSENDIDKVRIAGIGIGCPGPIDLEKGRILTTPNLGWDDLDVRKLLEEAFRLPRGRGQRRRCRRVRRVSSSEPPRGRAVRRDLSRHRCGWRLRLQRTDSARRRNQLHGNRPHADQQQCPVRRVRASRDGRGGGRAG